MELNSFSFESKIDTIPYDYTDVISTFEKKKSQSYKTFDELTMEGKGRTDKQPCVYVCDKGDYILVMSSNERDSLRLYIRKGKNLWYSHMDYDLWKTRGYAEVKSEWEKTARSYDRYFYNDTILELQTAYSEEHIYKTIIVKTSDVVYEFRMNDENLNSHIENLRSIAWLLSSGKIPYKKYCRSRIKYSFSCDEEKYYLHSENKTTTYEYAKNSLGIWAIQPGIDETCLHYGQDIRNYSQSSPNGIPDNNDSTVYTLVDQLPEFPGGYQALMDFYNNNGAVGKVQDYKHRVILKVIVERDGSITSTKVIHSPSQEYTKTSLKLISLMPKWKPAELGGRIVRCEYMFPIFLK